MPRDKKMTSASSSGNSDVLSETSTPPAFYTFWEIFGDPFCCQNIGRLLCTIPTTLFLYFVVLVEFEKLAHLGANPI